MTGKFIVIEGTDGSGKTEQFKRLVPKVGEQGPVATIDFPQYSEPSAHFVAEYLNGRYGTAEEVGPKKASLFYALDRYDASIKKMRAWLNEGKTIVANRYVGSSMGHQGGKIVDEKERLDFFKWLYDLEYGTLGIPKPDLNIILHMPAAMAQELVAKKAQREYLVGGKTHDLHEGNLAHLENAEKVYLQMAEWFPEDFKIIECVENGSLLSIDQIHEKVWAAAKTVLV
jgi:dTMP kinase